MHCRKPFTSVTLFFFLSCCNVFTLWSLWMLAVIYLPASAIWNADGFILKVKMPNLFCLCRGAGCTWDSCWSKVTLDTCRPLTQLCLVKISVALRLVSLLSGTGEPTSFLRVVCLFSLCCFMYWNIVVKIAGWGVMNVFKDLPLKEAFFSSPWWSPPIFLFCVRLSHCSYPQRPLVQTCQHMCQCNEIKWHGL